VFSSTIIPKTISDLSSLLARYNDRKKSKKEHGLKCPEVSITTVYNFWTIYHRSLSIYMFWHFVVYCTNLILGLSIKPRASCYCLMMLLGIDLQSNLLKTFDALV